MNVQNENFISVQGWMRTQLDLKGNDLLVYAIIYGFSQTENQSFTGSLQYLADWCGATKQGILKNLQSLMDKGLITKRESVINGIKYCEYSCIVLNSVEYPIKLSLTNNIANNKEINKTISKDIVATSGVEVKTKKKNLYQQCIDLINDFTNNEDLRNHLTNFLKICLENSRDSGKPFYKNSFQGKLNQLAKLSDDADTQIRIVMQTLDNGWAGFYELKNMGRNRDTARDIEHLSAGLNTRAKKGDIDGNRPQF